MSEKCNSCGAEIKYAAGSQSLKCQFCGALNEIKKAEDQLPDEVEKIIPLTVSQDDLEKRAYGYMASGNYTPDDMLEASRFTKREIFYVPAFLFKITYDATWTASFGYDRKEPYTDYRTVTRNNRQHQEAYTAYRTVTDWRPQNGVDSGIFPVSTYAGKRLGDSGLTPAELVPYVISKGSITDFNPSFMKGVETENFSVSEASAFASLKSEINSNIDHKVQSHGQGDHQKDWHWNATMSHSTNTLYVPICHAIFDYQGTEYNVWIDGIGEAGIRADKLPEDKGRKNLVYLGFVPAGVGIACLILTTVIWSFHFSGLVAAAIFGGYAAIRRKSIIDYSKNIRDSLLTQIHASSSTMKGMGSEERDKVARAFHHPEKPFFAKTHKDKLIIPALSFLALLGVGMSNNDYTSKTPQAVAVAPSENVAAQAPVAAPAPTAPVVVKAETASAVVAASTENWMKITEGKDGKLTLYVNQDSIRKTGDKAIIWEMVDYKTAAINTISGKAYLSVKSQDEFDCKENKWRSLNDHTGYTGNMGSGEITDTSSTSNPAPGEWSQAAPKTVMDVVGKVACKSTVPEPAGVEASPSPSLSQGPSFDCKKAKSASEILICNDSELSKLDYELAEIYRQAKAKAVDVQEFKKQTTAAWEWRESNCRDNKECLMKWYAERKTVLLKNI